MDFIDVSEMCPELVVDVRYATTDNFTGKILYDSPRCFLRRSVAEKLTRVQRSLEGVGLGLKVWDGYRPLRVQKVMWKLVPDPRYVADPTVGSKHNRGAAVDVTLVRDGAEMAMPTEFDAFCKEAHRDCDELGEEAKRNRDLLEKYMAAEGFIGLPTEWWHFDDCEWEMYPVMDSGFDEL